MSSVLDGASETMRPAGAAPPAASRAGLSSAAPAPSTVRRMRQAASRGGSKKYLRILLLTDSLPAKPNPDLGEARLHPLRLNHIRSVQQAPVVERHSHQPTDLLLVIGVRPAKIVLDRPEHGRDINDMRVLPRLLARLFVVALGVVGHRRADVPALPEHPAVDGRAVGDERGELLLLGDLRCQDLAFETLLIRDLADSPVTEGGADIPGQLRDDRQRQQRGQGLCYRGLAHSACAGQDYSPGVNARCRQDLLLVTTSASASRRGAAAS